MPKYLIEATYRPPDYEVDPTALAKWNSEGGHLRKESPGEEGRE